MERLHPFKKHAIKKEFDIFDNIGNAAGVSRRFNAGAFLGQRLTEDLSFETIFAINDKRLLAVRKFLSKFGLNPNHYIPKWQEAFSSNPARGIQINFSALCGLEAAKPGTGIVLAEEFGIANVGRYPSRFLLQQARDLKFDGKPYGIMIYPEADHNGSFFEDAGLIGRLSDNLRKDKIKLRVFEAATKRDLVTKLNRARVNYGLISFAILSGHGEEDVIFFGERQNGSVRTRDLYGFRAQSVGLAFENNPVIIMNSCSTGVDYGLGQTLSELGATVIAPSTDNSLVSVVPMTNARGKINFRVRYSEAGSLRKFKRGRAFNEGRLT